MIQAEQGFQAAKAAGDALSVGVAVGTILAWLPAVAALFTIVWTGLRIYETWLNLAERKGTKGRGRMKTRTSKLPRGVRLHNPGNLRKAGDWKAWQGLAAAQPDRAFVAFESPVWGLRAIARTLITYYDRHGCRTVRAVVERWAPAAENDTAAYVAHVAARVGVAPDAPLDLHGWGHMRPMVEAIVRHENGMQPYDPRLIDEALRLAGIVPPPLPAARDPKVIAASVAGGLTVAQQLVAQVADIRDSLAAMGFDPQWLFGAFGAVALAAASWFLLDRWRARRLGLA